MKALYDGLDARWNARARELNRRLDDAGLPVRVANLSSIWTVLYTRASRYNWMLQFYLRREGLALSWVGSGRLIFSLDYDDADFEAVARTASSPRHARCRRTAGGGTTRARPIDRSGARSCKEAIAHRW